MREMMACIFIQFLHNIFMFYDMNRNGVVATYRIKKSKPNIIYILSDNLGYRRPSDVFQFDYEKQRIQLVP